VVLKTCQVYEQAVVTTVMQRGELNAGCQPVRSIDPPIPGFPLSTVSGFTLGLVIMTFARCYTLWLINIAMENGPFIDGLPIKNGDFPWLC
jgi:hypothetical protein